VGRVAERGFTTGTPWIAVNPDFTEVNAQAAWADPDSVLHHYRRLIELRHTDPTVVHGDFTMLLPESPQVYAFTRASEQDELLVVVNVSSEPADVEVDAAWTGTELVLGTHPAADRSGCVRGRRACTDGEPDAAARCAAPYGGRIDREESGRVDGDVISVERGHPGSRARSSTCSRRVQAPRFDGSGTVKQARSGASSG
jgi:hypothetical protein